MVGMMLAPSWGSAGPGRLLACCGELAGRRLFSSSGRRNFYQRINEQHLAHELRGLAEEASQGREPLARPLFDPQVRLRPSRPSAGAGAFQSSASLGSPGEESGGSSGSRGPRVGRGEFGRQSKKARPWLHYESLRGSTYPPGEAGGPRWQDLTHAEAQRLQEMYERKKVLDRKIRWLKSLDLPNPEKEAKLTRQRQQRDEEARKDAEAERQDLYPLPFLEAPPGDRRIKDMEEKSRLEELESRFRNRIREEKQQNARIVKAAVPSVGDAVVDPIKRHVGRRLVRQRVKIQAGLEDALHRNSAQILYEFLRGVSISIVKVRAKRPRQTQEIFYSITSSHDPAWVQRQLEVLAPKLRSQLATRVNMGQTPNIKFVPQASSQEAKRKYLWQFAKKLQDETPLGGGFGSAVNVKPS